MPACALTGFGSSMPAVLVPLSAASSSQPFSDISVASAVQLLAQALAQRR